MQKIFFQSQIDKITSNEDRTMKIRLDTQEMTPEEAAAVFSLQGQHLYAVVSPNPVTESDLEIPDVVMEFKQDKTPSQRMRNTIYVLWSKNYKNRFDFETYYKSKIGELIEIVKRQIPD